MTLDELLAKVPDKFRPLAVQYAPAFLAMGEGEVLAWIDRLARGDLEGAYRQVLEKLPNGDLFAEFETLNKAWANENAASVARLSVVRQALAGVLQVLLTIALAMVGL